MGKYIKIWQRWKMFSVKIVDIQANILLFFIYFIIIPFIALPLKIFNIHVDKEDKVWVIRNDSTDFFDQMKKQY
jgi:hypothetical protein